MIKPPCMPDCPDRGPGCHNDSCRHGWKEYQEKILALRRQRAEDIEAQSETVSSERRKRKNLKIKQKKTGK